MIFIKIYLDPGHGGRDSGAIGNGFLEKNLTLDISLRQAKLFKQLGHQVKLSRDTDVFVSLSQRANEANTWGADIFISNHINAGGGVGAEIWHSIYGGKGKEYATNIEKELSKLTNSRGLKSKRGENEDYLYVIRATKMPAVLNEFGFIDNLRDVNRLKDSTFRQKLAEAVVKGVTGQSVTEVSNQVSNTTSNLDGKRGIVTASVLNVRSGPGIGYKIIGKLTKGQTVKLFKRGGNWIDIYFGDHGGYVSVKYIKLI